MGHELGKEPNTDAKYVNVVYPSNVKCQHISSNCQVPNADAIVFENRLFYALSSAVGQTLI